MSGCKECKDIYKKPCEQLNYLDVANNCTDLRKLVEDIRAEVIEECINIVLDLPSKYIDYFDYVPLALLHKQLEQLKERNK